MKSQRKWKHGKSNVEKVRRKEEARAFLLFLSPPRATISGNKAYPIK